MISASELMAVKARLMLAADAANLIVSTPGPAPVRFSEEQYWRVHEALSQMKEDLGLVFTELDTLRGLFVDSVHEFFETKVLDEISVGSNPVEPVSGSEDRGGSEASRDDEAVPSKPAPTGGPNRRKRSRAKSGADTTGVQGVEEKLDRGDAPEPVGG